MPQQTHRGAEDVPGRLLLLALLGGVMLNHMRSCKILAIQDGSTWESQAMVPLLQGFMIAECCDDKSGLRLMNTLELDNFHMCRFVCSFVFP